MSTVDDVKAGANVGRGEETARWIMLGALVAPLPLLEIRAPLIGDQLDESLRLAIAIMGAGVALGMVGALLIRRLGPRGETVAAVVAGALWIAAAMNDSRILLAAAIIVGLGAGWTAVLSGVHKGVSGRGILGAAAAVVVCILVPFAIWQDSRWEPLAAVCGVIAVVAAGVLLRADQHASPSPSQLPSVPWTQTIRHGALLSVAAGVTWGTTPAVNRVTWQEFRAAERYSSITVLGGALFAVLFAVAAALRLRRNASSNTPVLFRRETAGALIAVAFVVIAVAPTLTITMIARAVALGGADLLIAGLATNEPAQRQAARWPFAALGVVGGLMFTAVVTVIDSIDPRHVVAFLAVCVLLATSGDLLLAKRPQTQS